MNNYVKIGLALGAIGAVIFIVYKLANSNTRLAIVSGGGVGALTVDQLPAAGG